MEASVLDSLNMDHSDAEDSSGMDFPTLHEIKLLHGVVFVIPFWIYALRVTQCLLISSVHTVP